MGAKDKGSESRLEGMGTGRESPEGDRGGVVERWKDAWRAFWTEADTKLGVTAPSAVTTLLREQSRPGGACWRSGSSALGGFWKRK